MEVVQQMLNIVIGIGLLFAEHSHRRTNSFTHRSLGGLGLENMLVAKFLFLIRDSEKFGAKLFQVLDGHFLGVHDCTKILCVR